MTALSAHAAVQIRNDAGATKYSFVINTGSKIYRHALVVINASGTAQPAANDTTTTFVGMAMVTPVDANGLVASGDGTLRVEVQNDFEYLCTQTLTAITVGDTGVTAMHAGDDSLVTTATTLGAEIGVMTEFVAANSAWIGLRTRKLIAGA